MEFEDGKGGHFSCFPKSWNDTSRVVVDTHGGRRIVHLSSSDYDNASALLEEIMNKEFKVALYGQRSAECSQELIWATEKR